MYVCTYLYVCVCVYLSWLSNDSKFVCLLFKQHSPDGQNQLNCFFSEIFSPTYDCEIFKSVLQRDHFPQRHTPFYVLFYRVRIPRDYI